MEQKEREELLSAEDVAKYLNVSKGLIYKLVRANKIPYRRIGNKTVRFTPEAIHKYVNGLDKGVDEE